MKDYFFQRKICKMHVDELKEHIQRKIDEADFANCLLEYFKLNVGKKFTKRDVYRLRSHWPNKKINSHLNARVRGTFQTIYECGLAKIAWGYDSRDDLLYNYNSLLLSSTMDCVINIDFIKNYNECIFGVSDIQKNVMKAMLNQEQDLKGIVDLINRFQAFRSLGNERSWVDFFVTKILHSS